MAKEGMSVQNAAACLVSEAWRDDVVRVIFKTTIRVWEMEMRPPICTGVSANYNFKTNIVENVA